MKTQVTFVRGTAVRAAIPVYLDGIPHVRLREVFNNDSAINLTAVISVNSF